MPIECPTPCAQQNSLTKVLFNYVLLFESRWVRTSRLVWILSISSSSLIPSSERSLVEKGICSPVKRSSNQAPASRERT